MEFRSRSNTNDSTSYSHLKSYPDPAKLQYENIPRLSVSDIDNASIHSNVSEQNNPHGSDFFLPSNDSRTHSRSQGHSQNSSRKHSHNQQNSHSNDFFTKVTGLISRKFSSSSRYSSSDSLANILNHSNPQSQSPSQFNSPLHSTHNSVYGSPLPFHLDNAFVKETNHISLEYDPINKRRVLNTYEILKEIGRGQHGKVKLARELLSNELVAIKIIDRRQKKPKLGLNLERKMNENEMKIKREISIMKNCNYKHVVKLIEVLDDLKSRKIYLVLEYLKKGEVKWSDGGEPTLSFKEARSIFKDVLLGLEYLHFQGIVHRDIKPANLLISEDNVVKISDFGVSFTNYFDGEKNDLDLAKTAGTPAFFAPELCQTNFFDELNKMNTSSSSLQQTQQSQHSCNSQQQLKEYRKYKITHKIDIWALGITLYCLLFGKVPFDAESEFELFNVIVNNELEVPPKDSLPNASSISRHEYESCKNLLGKLLTKNPDMRIDVPDIKRHEFVTWDMTTVEKTQFWNENKEYNHRKIIVNNEDLGESAVLGVGNKLRKSIVKALSFVKSDESEPEQVSSNVNSRNTSASSNSTTSKNLSVSGSVNRLNVAGVSKTSTTDQRSHSNLVHSLILSESISTPVSQLSPSITRAATPILPSIDSSFEHNNYNKISRPSGEALLIETRRNVSGDLYIKNQSARDTIKDLITKNDKRRSSISTVNSEGSNTCNSPYSSQNPYQGLQRSFASPISFSKKSNSNISLPINESFASLDSFSEEYLKYKYDEATDNSIMKNYDLNLNMQRNSPATPQVEESIEPKQRDSFKTPRNSIIQPYSTDNSRTITMNMQYSSSVTPSSGSSHSSSSDSCDDESDEENDDKELTLQFGPKRDLPQSPPYLRKRVMSHESKLSRNLQRVKQPSGSANFFELDNSLELPLGLQGDIPEFLDVPDSLINGDTSLTSTPRRPSLTAPASISRIETIPHKTSDSKDEVEASTSVNSDSISTIIPTTPTNRPNTASSLQQSATPVLRFHKKLKDERIPSPLSQNAPHSSIATINSHLTKDLTPAERYKFINHYSKDPIIPPFPNSIHLNDNKSVFKSGFLDNNNKNNGETSNNHNHQRSTSISVGILQFDYQKDESV